MRIVLVSALLLATASCAWAPPSAAVPPPGQVAVARPTPLVPAPPPAPAVVPVTQAPRAPVPLSSAAPPPGIVLAPATPSPVVAVKPPPAPVAAARPAQVVAAAPLPPIFLPRWMSWIYGRSPFPSPGRMTLSNFTLDLAEVQALVTPYPDCLRRPGMVPVDMKVPLNGTFVVDAPPGSDVCWRSRAESPEIGLAPITAPAAAPSEWGPWNRVFTSYGHSVSAEL